MFARFFVIQAATLVGLCWATLDIAGAYGGEPQEMPINLREATTEIPERVAGIATAVQIYRGFDREVIREGDRFKEVRLLYADPGFFRVFDLDILAGNGDRALADPSAVVLSEKTARKIFGDEDPVGQSLKMDGELYTVSAMVQEVPPNTHFKFDMLMPMESVPDLDHMGGLEFFTYYLLEEGANHEEVTRIIAKENTGLLTDRFSSFGSFTFDSRLTPQTRLHLHSGISWDLTTPGNIRTITIMVILTIAVMGLALSNFIIQVRKTRSLQTGYKHLLLITNVVF